MRKIWIMLALLTATYLFAQDDAPSGALSGGGGSQVFTRVDAINPMDQVKTFLAKASITLNSDQEKALRPAGLDTIKQRREMGVRVAAEGGGRDGRGRRGEERERGGGGAVSRGARCPGLAALSS